MGEPERIVGEDARILKPLLENEETVAVFEGGYLTCGEIRGIPVLFSSDSMAAELADELDEDLSTVVQSFPDFASRDRYLNEGSAGDALRMRGWTTSPPSTVDRSKLGAGGALLAASIAWLEEVEGSGRSPSEFDERAFQVFLAGQLAEAFGAEMERDIREAANRSGKIPGWNPGGVDLVLETVEGTVWAELKWTTRTAGGLEHCLWDAAKLAGAVRADAAAAGYLVAGAPKETWDTKGRYRRVTELFDFSTWEAGSIITEYETTWSAELDRNESTFPQELVSPIQTLPVGRAEIESEHWEVRIARVCAPGDGTVSVREFLRDT